MLTRMEQIVMDFGPVRAVDHVDLVVKPGEVVGLLGENGAGKSTLMNVLAGTFPPTEGTIYLDEKPVKINNASQAMAHGIRFIHQELNLCNDLTVFENMYLSQELQKGFLLDKKEMARRCAEVFSRMNVDIDPWAKVEDLQIADKQLIEIARALLFKADLIIMDEPTTALSNKEIDNLFVIMRQLKQDGVGFIYISHKMPEIFEICDTYFVMRDGKLIGNGAIKDINEMQITEMMIGRSLADEEFDNKPNYSKDEIALKVSGLCGSTFRNISFDLHKGEILAITGLQSSGSGQLADALFGVEPVTAGTVELNGKPLRGSIKKHMHGGMAMVPRNRKERGIHNDLSIQDNISMGYFNTLMKELLISPKREKERFLRQQKAMKIKTENERNLITSLSGGNQQKVILGRWLETGADVLIFDNPTQGIDVGTKFEIYHLLIDLARQGKSILVFSSEFPEIMKVADRCMIMYLGQVTKELSRAEMSGEEIMYYSTGSNFEGVADSTGKEVL